MHQLRSTKSIEPLLAKDSILTTLSRIQEFNARTAHYNPGTPIPALVTVRPDRSFTFSIRTPPTATLLLSAAGVAPTKQKLKGAGKTPGPKAVPTPVSLTSGADEDGASAVPAKGPAAPTPKGTVVAAGNSNTSKVGQISLKHVFEIAKIKQSETRLQGVELEGLVKTVVAQAGSMGVEVVP